MSIQELEIKKLKIMIKRKCKECTPEEYDCMITSCPLYRIILDIRTEDEFDKQHKK